MKTRKHTELAAEIAHRRVTVTLTDAAQAALADRTKPLVAEAEVLFSCLIRKRLTFRDHDADQLSWPVSDVLHVAVRPVLYELCKPEPGATEPPIVDFVVDDITALLPGSITIDHVDGAWTGSFHY